MLAAHTQSLSSSVADVEARHMGERDEMSARHKVEHADLRRRHDTEDANNREWKNNPDRRIQHRAKEHADLAARQRRESRERRNRHIQELNDVKGAKPTVDHNNWTDRQTSAFDQERRRSSAFDYGRHDTLSSRHQHELDETDRRQKAELQDLDRAQHEMRGASARYDHHRSAAHISGRQRHDHVALRNATKPNAMQSKHDYAASVIRYGNCPSPCSGTGDDG